MNLFYTGMLADPAPYLELIKDLELNVLSDQDLDQTITQLLAGQHGQSAEAKEASFAPLLFFEDATPDEALAVQDRFIEAGLEAPLLAGKTEMNQDWTLRALLEELSQEDLYMALYNEIAERLQKADPIRMNQDDAYAQAYMAAALALRDEAELDVLKHALARIMDLDNAG